MEKGKPSTDIVLFKTDDNRIHVSVIFEDETVWLSQEQMAALFEKGRSTITEHIQNVFKEGELYEKLVCREFRHVTQHSANKGKNSHENERLG